MIVVYMDPLGKCLGFRVEGSICSNSIYFGSKVLVEGLLNYLKAKVYYLWTLKVSPKGPSIIMVYT